MGRITKEAQKKGGRNVVKIHGLDHMKKIGKAGALKRWAKNKRSIKKRKPV